MNKLTCCEHNPCPTKPPAVGKHRESVWVCPGCGQKWVEVPIRPEYIYWNAYRWEKA